MTAGKQSNSNIDLATVEGFGREWASFDQTTLDAEEHERLFDAYFSVFPPEAIRPDAEGFDLGCGSGRWAALIAPHVGILHCIDPAGEALKVAKRRLAEMPSARFHLAGVDAIPLRDDSQDFGYSLGVLHHIPDTEAAMLACVRKLKLGAPFLVYLYYALDDKPLWFRAVWRTSDWLRRGISRLPFRARKATTDVIAALVYLPLSRFANLGERLRLDVSNIPLSAYRKNSWYTLRTDALDRFGTRLEHRFSRSSIEAMMRRCGLDDIVFREDVPYWIACGRRRI